MLAWRVVEARRWAVRGVLGVVWPGGVLGCRSDGAGDMARNRTDREDVNGRSLPFLRRGVICTTVSIFEKDCNNRLIYISLRFYP